jgi:hypothetical protein
MFIIVLKMYFFNYEVFQIFCLSINCNLIIIFYATENFFTLTKVLTYDLRRIHELERISIFNPLLNSTLAIDLETSDNFEKNMFNNVLN